MGRLEMRILALIAMLAFGVTAGAAVDTPGAKAAPPSQQSAGGETEEEPAGTGEEEEEEPGCD